jgi:hypothetical protein
LIRNSSKDDTGMQVDMHELLAESRMENRSVVQNSQHTGSVGEGEKMTEGVGESE